MNTAVQVQINKWPTAKLEIVVVASAPLRVCKTAIWQNGQSSASARPYRVLIMWLQLGGVCSSSGARGAGVKGVHSGDGGRPIAGLSSVNGRSSAHVLTIHLSKEKAVGSI